MSKLYPPNIQGTIPAFCGTTIVVPFSMSGAVSKREVSGFKLLIKDIKGNLKTLQPLYVSAKNNENFFEKNRVLFDCSNVSFTIGSYYKVQLAYVDKNGVAGYYSNVAITKYTSVPQVFIEGMVEGTSKLNGHTYNYTGVYRPFNENITDNSLKDPTEKMYSSRFKIFEKATDELVVDSGEILHNITTDKDIDNLNDTATQREVFHYPKELDPEKIYYMIFYVKTLNNLLTSVNSEYIQSPKYRLVQRNLIPSNLDVELVAELNYDEGYTELHFEGPDTTKGVTGKFVISRAADVNNYEWEDYYKCDLESVKLGKWKLRDFTIEQGVTYKYSIQQYNDSGIYSERIISNLIYADYEDMFLYDGKVQLKVRYNPKVSIYRIDISEAKVDAIGNKYPFIIREGHTNYRELNISGTVSYLMDENSMFFERNKLPLEYLPGKKTIPEKGQTIHPFGTVPYVGTDITSYNMASERIFKNEVLYWLNNGENKLLKTPAEGLFLVRLMNIALSPKDTLSRMIHDFSAVAYEIGPTDLASLKDYHLLDNLTDENAEEDPTISSTNLLDLYLQEKTKNPDLTILSLPSTDLIAFKLSDMTPGDKVLLTVRGADDVLEEVEITIGITGTYELEDASNVEEIRAKVNPNRELVGNYTYVGKTRVPTAFDLLNSIELNDYPAKQIVGLEDLKNNVVFGSGVDWGVGGVLTYEEFEKLPNAQTRYEYWKSHLSDNILAYLQDLKTEISQFYFLKFEARPQAAVYISKEDSNKVKESGTNTSINDLKFYNNNDDAQLNRPPIDLEVPNSLFILGIYYLKTNRENYLDINHDGYYPDYKEEEFSEHVWADEEKTKCYAYDAKINKIIIVDDSTFKIKVDGEIVDLSEDGDLYVEDIHPKSLVLGQGVNLDMSYSTQTKVYNAEKDTTISPLEGDYNGTVEDKSKYLQDLTERVIAEKEGRVQ